MSSGDGNIEFDLVEPELEVIPGEVTIDQVRSRLEELRNEPCFEQRDLIGCVNFTSINKRVEQVDPKKIIGGPFIDNWATAPKFNDYDYIVRMANAIKEGKLELTDGPIELFDLGGVYIISHDGIHRTVTAKVLEFETVPANVDKLKLRDIHALWRKEFDVLLKRREEGLWEGDLEEQPVDSGFYAVGKVTSYEGIWVFSKDMEKVREAFIKLGASGKI